MGDFSRHSDEVQRQGGARSSTDRTSSSSTQDSRPQDHLRPAASVRIDGLKSAPELNGVVGKCLWPEDNGSRWVVRLDDGQMKKLRSINLTALHVPDAPWPARPG